MPESPAVPCHWPGWPQGRGGCWGPRGPRPRGQLLQLPLPGVLHPVGQHQHPAIPQRVVTSMLVLLCGERGAGHQGGRDAGGRPPRAGHPPPTMPPPRITLQEGLHSILRPQTPPPPSFTPSSLSQSGGGFPLPHTHTPGQEGSPQPPLPGLRLGWALPGVRREAAPAVPLARKQPPPTSSSPTSGSMLRLSRKPRRQHQHRPAGPAP